MNLDNIGKSIGDILGMKKKKQPTPVETLIARKPTNIGPIGSTIKTTPTLQVGRPATIKFTPPSIQQPIKNSFTDTIRQQQNLPKLPTAQEVSIKKAQDLYKINPVQWGKMKPELQKGFIDTAAATEKANREVRSTKATAKFIQDFTSPVRNIASGIVTAGAQIPGTAVELAGNIGRLVTPDDKEKMFVDWAKTGQKMNQEVAKATENIFQTKKDKGIVKDLTQTVGQLGFDVATGGIPAAIRHASQVYNDTFNQAKSKGKSDEEASLKAGASAGIQGFIEKLGMDKLLGPAGKNVVSKALSRFISEGTEEASQQLVDNSIKWTSDPTIDIWENVPYSALLGGLAGGGSSVAIDITSGKIPPAQVENKVKEVTKEINDNLEKSGSKIRVTEPEIAATIAQQIENAPQVSKTEVLDYSPKIRTNKQSGNKIVTYETIDADGTRRNVVFKIGKDGKKTITSEYIDVNGEVTDVVNLGSYEKAAQKYGTKDPNEIALRATTGEVKSYNKTGEPIWTINGKFVDIPTPQVSKTEGFSQERLDSLNRLKKEGVTELPVMKDGVKVASSLVQDINGELNLLLAASSKSGQGYGKTSVEMAKKMADEAGRPLTAYSKSVSSFAPDGTSLGGKDLTNFYKKLGFVQDTRYNNPDRLIYFPTSAKPKVVVKKKPIAKKKQVAFNTQDIDAKLQQITTGSKDTDYKVSKIGSAAEKYSINKLARKITRPFEAVSGKAIRKMETSGNRLVRTPSSIITGFSKQFGNSKEEFLRGLQYQGEKRLGDIEAKAFAAQGTDALANNGRLDAIINTLDPELAKARGVDTPKLTTFEKGEVNKIRETLDLVHEGNYRMGLIDKETYEKNKGNYMPRDFSEYFAKADSGFRMAKDFRAELEIFKQRKDLTELDPKVVEAAEQDPYFLAALRVQQYHHNKAIFEYTNYLAKSGYTSDTPKKGYVKIPDSPAYAGLKGKYLLKEQAEELQGFIYETKSAQAAMTLLNAYDRNPIRKARKFMLTVLNPGVRLGNRTFNYWTTSLNGINPVTFTKNYARGRKMIRSNSPEYIEAAKNGIFGSNFVDKELYHTRGIKPEKSTLKKAVNKISETYQDVDDEAKMAAYLTLRERGVGEAEAAYRTARMLQNYDQIGKFFDISAKMPIGGNAFVRFSSELIRIGHNTAIENPVRAAGAMAAVSTLITLASELSGESEEDRKTREHRVGAPRIPFTDQSLEIQTPWGAVNLSRLLGISTYNSLSGGMDTDSQKFLPFTSPVKKGATGAIEFNPAFVTNDPLIGPVLAQLIDMDFRGKKISDPENTGQFDKDLEVSEQIRNRLNAARMAYMPLSNETDNIISGITGKETFYGKKLSLLQSILKTFGVKVEQYGPEEAKKAREVEGFFDEKKYLDSKAATLPRKEAEAYKRLTGYYKSRNKVPNEFSPGTERYQKAAIYNFPEDKWAEYVSNPKVYDLVMEKKQLDSLRQGSPIQPEFDERLSKEFRTQLINNKSKAPGEDAEADERLYTDKEWDKYQSIKKQYENAAKLYYPQKGDEFVDEMVKHKTTEFPTKGAAKKAYDDAYALYLEGKGEKPAYTDQVDAEKEVYNEAKRIWTNKERAARGLAPISKEMWDNVTFGYMSDEEKVYKQLKYGKGYGGYSGGSGKSSYRISLSAGGELAKPPTGSSKAPVKFKSVAGATVKKPTVKITKSKV